MMMNHGRREANGNFTVFHTFVCISLTLLLGMHTYSYFWGLNPETLDGDFSNIKYIIMQLSRSLSEVNRKHEHLEDEMERISAVLPKVAAAAGKAKDALDPFRHNTNVRPMGDVVDYDRQIADYALETAGGKVIDTGDTIDYVIYESPVSWALYMFSALLCRECLGARAMISPSALPGECWAFKGSRGEATIRLLGTVKITGVSIEHIPPHISPTREISSAPRLCEVEGLEYRSDPYPHSFGSFEYDKNGKPIQYFDVLHPANKGYNLVKFRVLTNWGNPVHTCVYRFRVHGELAPGQGPKMDDKGVSSENE